MHNLKSSTFWNLISASSTSFLKIYAMDPQICKRSRSHLIIPGARIQTNIQNLVAQNFHHPAFKYWWLCLPFHGKAFIKTVQSCKKKWEWYEINLIYSYVCKTYNTFDIVGQLLQDLVLRCSRVWKYLMEPFLNTTAHYKDTYYANFLKNLHSKQYMSLDCCENYRISC
jgi:hypothetical protein